MNEKNKWKPGTDNPSTLSFMTKKVNVLNTILSNSFFYSNTNYCSFCLHVNKSTERVFSYFLPLSSNQIYYKFVTNI